MLKIIKGVRLFAVLLVMAVIPGVAIAANLEEKVESLEKIVAQQQQQIDALSKEKKAPLSLFNNDKVSISLYGQLNRAVLVVDDGDDSEFYSVDNAHSSTRIGLKGESKAFEGVTLGTLFEVEYRANPSSKVSQTDTNYDDGFEKRHIDIFVDFERFGKLSLGHGDTASNGTSEVDLSGTTVIGYSSIADFSGGQFFYDKSGKSLTTTTIGSVFSNLDGLSRESRVRYDSPKLAGFMLSGSALSGGGYDAALRYSLDEDAFDLQAAMAYSYDEDGKEIVNGSASILLNSGLNFTIAGGQKDFDTSGRDDGAFIYGKIGYIFKVFSIGDSACSVDMGQNDDISAAGEKAVSTGIQLVQNVDKWNTQLYLGFRNHDLDRPGLEDVNALMSGLRVKF